MRIPELNLEVTRTNAGLYELKFFAIDNETIARTMTISFDQLTKSAEYRHIANAIEMRMPHKELRLHEGTAC